MAVATATFLVNLLCSFVSCDVPMPPPEISSSEPLLADATGTGPGTGRALSSPTSGFISGLSPFIQESEPFVITRIGGLHGYLMKTMGNRRIYAFEGVPYAEPPVGYFRFRQAAPKHPWRGIRDARRPGPQCLQLNLPKVLRVLGNEDCLYLNVYTPQIPNINRRDFNSFVQPFPVIVNIHGGSYYFGSGNELGPAYLLDNDVVFVDFNYRLGVLGFMSSGDGHSPGNYGLKDQALAIKWVFDNIASFGGDPNRITLFGQSSGAASVHLHLIANQTTPYFQSGVSLSGSAFTHWAIKSPKESLRLTTTLAKAVLCPTLDTGAMVECLRQKNAVELVSAQYPLLEFSPFPVTLFSPVIEPKIQGSYLTTTPKAAYEHNEVDPKPWIFTMVAQEGYLGLLFLQSFILERTLRSQWESLAPIYLDYKYTARNVSEVTRRLTQFYFGYKTPITAKENKLATIFGDRLMLPGVNQAIETHSLLAPTFAYIFGYQGKYTLGSRVGRESSDWGVQHAEDLYYFFNSSTWLPGFKKSDVDERSMSAIMTSMLANFASRGEPLITQPNKVDVRVWQPVIPGDVRFLQINKELRMIPQPFRKRINFWQRLGQFDPNLLNPLVGG